MIRPTHHLTLNIGKLGHPEGEVCLTRAAGEHGVIQMASRPLPLVAQLIPSPDPHARFVLLRRDGGRRCSWSESVHAAVRSLAYPGDR